MVELEKWGETGVQLVPASGHGLNRGRGAYYPLNHRQGVSSYRRLFAAGVWHRHIATNLHIHYFDCLPHLERVKVIFTLWVQHH